MGGDPNNHKRVSVLLLFGVLIALIAFGVVSQGASGPVSAISGGGPEMVLNVSGGSCDDPVRPTKCTVFNGSTFDLSVDALSVPALGYTGAQAWIDYGDVLGDQSANGAVKAASAVWPDCDAGLLFEANTDQSGASNFDSYYAGCISGLIPPRPVSFHVGSLFTVTLTCPFEWGTHVIELLPYGSPPAVESGAAFTDEDENIIVPKVSSLTINCQHITATAIPGGINGTLYESFSGYMRGATVRLEPLGFETITSIQDGSFSFSGVPDGAHTIVVTSPGCTPFGCYYAVPVIVSGDKVSVSIYPKPTDSDTDGDTIPNGSDPDDDNDGCSDTQEAGKDETLGGVRGPHNPWDFYDVETLSGPGQDGVVDLLFDILGVINHYQPAVGGAPPYDAHYDRGPTAGPNAWNMTAPDGVIDLLNDILGVIQQYDHRCT